MKIEVLDHGYVSLIETWGSDARIVEAARMSTNKGFRGWGPLAPHTDDCDKFHQQVKNFDKDMDDRQVPCSCGGKPGDERLLRFLYEHKHMTPFEMAGMTIEVQAPIFVFREWHRHRTQSYNELSARYTPMPDVNYVPSVERLMMDGGKNKQASSTGAVLTPELAEEFRADLSLQYYEAEDVYQHALKSGVPKELARLVIPVGRYSRMRASANLRNWLGFLTLRMDEAAQWEIRQYANIVGTMIEQHFPRTWELFSGK